MCVYCFVYWLQGVNIKSCLFIGINWQNIMDFDSPEEKEFPGLFASEAADGKSKKSKEESDCK